MTRSAGLGASAATFLGLVLCTLPATGFAGTETLTVRGSDTVQSPSSGRYRVFFQVSTPTQTNIAIRKATLRIPYTATGGGGRGVPLRVMPVTAPWNLGGASWTSWQREGGDFDEELYSDTVVSAARAGTATFDVTVAVKEWLEDSQPSHGFVLTVPSPVRDGIEAEDLGLPASLGSAELVIDSMPLASPRGSGRGRASSRPTAVSGD